MSPHFFKEGDIIITNELIIANKFNSFFTNIGSTFSNQIRAPKNKCFNLF